MKLDLTDAELDELDALLAETPAPLEPMDVAMLDGYLCGVIVQPQTVPPSQWQPPVLDRQARPLPDDHDPRWAARVQALLVRRHEALARALEEDGVFSPVLPPADGEPHDAALRDAMRELPAPSRVLLRWALGFQAACLHFPALQQLGEPAVDAALARVFRHLPPATATAREASAALDRSLPLPNEDAAVDDLVDAVAELWELTEAQRLRVATVRRSGAKVGRNDPCPCGSGRKFKQCHGTS